MLLHLIDYFSAQSTFFEALVGSGDLLETVARIDDRRNDTLFEQPLMLAMDATSLKNRFVVLVIAVEMEKTAISVAWKVLKAEQPGSWRPLWLALLAHLKSAVPEHPVADKGLQAILDGNPSRLIN